MHSVTDSFVIVFNSHNSRCTLTCSWNFNTGSIMRLEKFQWQSGMIINYREFCLINCTPRRAIACSRGTAINSAALRERPESIRHRRPFENHAGSLTLDRIGSESGKTTSLSTTEKANALKK